MMCDITPTCILHLGNQNNVVSAKNNAMTSVANAKIYMVMKSKTIVVLYLTSSQDDGIRPVAYRSGLEKKDNEKLLSCITGGPRADTSLQGK